MPGKSTATVNFVVPPPGLGAVSPDSRRPTSPRFGFGSTSRETAAKVFVSDEVTGRSPRLGTASIDFHLANAVDKHGATGKQVLSPFPTAPAFRFGTEDREQTSARSALPTRRMRKAVAPPRLLR